MDLSRRLPTSPEDEESRTLATSTPATDLTTATNPEHISNSSVSLHALPTELLHIIYIHALSNLEIPAILDNKPTISHARGSRPKYILSPTSLSIIHFYQTTFFPFVTTQQTNTITPWESHVLFVFPSTLALQDVFGSPAWSASSPPPDRLSLVRKVRLFEPLSNIGYGPGRVSKEIVLARPVVKDLKLDVFEYPKVTEEEEAEYRRNL